MVYDDWKPQEPEGWAAMSFDEQMIWFRTHFFTNAVDTRREREEAGFSGAIANMILSIEDEQLRYNVASVWSCVPEREKKLIETWRLNCQAGKLEEGEADIIRAGNTDWKGDLNDGHPYITIDMDVSNHFDKEWQLRLILHELAHVIYGHAYTVQFAHVAERRHYKNVADRHARHMAGLWLETWKSQRLENQSPA